MSEIVYLKKREERKIISIDKCINASIQELNNYIKKSKEGLITINSKNTGNIRTNRKITKTI